MQNITEQYKGVSGRKLSFIGLLAVVLLGVAFIALSQGASSVGFKDSFTALFDQTGFAHAIIWKLRLPRIVMAMSGDTQKPFGITLHPWNSIERRIWSCGRNYLWR